MKKALGFIYSIFFVFTSLACFGQIKKVIDIDSKTKNIINIDSILKFIPVNQAIMDSLEEEINPKIIKINEYAHINHFRTESEKEFNLLYLKHFRSKNEMNLLLQKYNLNNDSVFYQKPVDGGDVNIYNKWDKQRERIDKKYGGNFIDSLIYIAEKQYVQNNIDKVFDFEECDTISRFSGDKNYEEFFYNHDKDFFIYAKYPKDFEYRNEKDLYSSLEADFILDKNGAVSDIKTGITFQNKYNNKFATYFRKKLIKFIKKSKWVPAKSMGITVTSKVPLIFLFK